MRRESAKTAASIKALDFVQDDMLLGLGSGSTTTIFIHHLIDRCQQGLRIQAIATSKKSEELACNGKIPLLDPYTITSLDLTIDGADEIDSQMRLIKGGGGALVREKIIASMSNELIVIADESKLVKQLGAHPLPIEVIPFGAEATKKHIERLGFFGNWRKNTDGSIFITDNQNWILDISLSSTKITPEDLHQHLIEIPGVVDTGFFFHLAKRCVIGKADGSVKILE